MAKKVGILFGMEDTFPWAFIDKVNELGKGAVIAEPVMIDKLEQGADYGYAVIIDRISQDVPFYRAYLKNAALNGTYVMNNPFWWSADEKFFNNALIFCVYKFSHNFKISVSICSSLIETPLSDLQLISPIHETFSSNLQLLQRQA